MAISCKGQLLTPAYPSQVVGTFGTVHPEVLGNFELEFPTSAADLDLQAFL